MAKMPKSEAEKLWIIGSFLSKLAAAIRQNRFSNCDVNIYPFMDEDTLYPYLGQNTYEKWEEKYYDEEFWAERDEPNADYLSSRYTWALHDLTTHLLHGIWDHSDTCREMRGGNQAARKLAQEAYMVMDAVKGMFADVFVHKDYLIHHAYVDIYNSFHDELVHLSAQMRTEAETEHPSVAGRISRAVDEEFTKVIGDKFAIRLFEELQRCEEPISQNQAARRFRMGKESVAIARDRLLDLALLESPSQGLLLVSNLPSLSEITIRAKSLQI